MDDERAKLADEMAAALDKVWAWYEADRAERFGTIEPGTDVNALYADAMTAVVFARIKYHGEGE